MRSLPDHHVHLCAISCTNYGCMYAMTATNVQAFIGEYLFVRQTRSNTQVIASLPHCTIVAKFPRAPIRHTFNRSTKVLALHYHPGPGPD